MAKLLDLLDHINKVKALAGQLTCLEVHVRNKDVVMILLESLSPSYEYLITTLKTMSIKELTTEYVMTRLMQEVSKRKEKEPKDDNATMVLRQGKMTIHLGIKMSIRFIFMANPATLLVFVIRQKIKNKKILQTTPKMMMITRL